MTKSGKQRVEQNHVDLLKLNKEDAYTRGWMEERETKKRELGKEEESSGNESSRA